MNLLTVTDKAAAELLSALKDVEPEPGQLLRLTYEDGSGFGLMLDEEKDADQVVESSGQKLLLVGSDIAAVVAGATIDVRDSDEGPRLTISR